jgi:hypothetical protein
MTILCPEPTTTQSCPPGTVPVAVQTQPQQYKTIESHGDGMGMIGAVLLAIIVIVGFILLESLIVLLLWNWVVPRIFKGASLIDFGTAFGLVLLINVLGGIWTKTPLWNLIVGKYQ